VHREYENNNAIRKLSEDELSRRAKLVISIMESQKSKEIIEKRESEKQKDKSETPTKIMKKDSKKLDKKSPENMFPTQIKSFYGSSDL